MKILIGNGRTLDVYDARLVMHIAASGVPIKYNGTRVFASDDEARAALRQVLEYRDAAGYAVEHVD